MTSVLLFFIGPLFMGVSFIAYTLELKRQYDAKNNVTDGEQQPASFEFGQ
jgi:hypothetical protein